MKLFDVMENTGFTFLRGYNAEISGIAKDIKDVREGTLFVCIRGLKFDGHSLIDEAVAHGAIAVMIDRDLEKYPDVAVVKVENTRAGLSYAASNFHGKPTDSFKLVGVTGTKGKTSTTYYMEEVLKAFGGKVGVIGTVGARIGADKVDIPYVTATTPDTIELQKIFAEMRDKGVQYVVMEVSSHALELKKVEGINFDVGIFTNLAHDHLEFHGTMENYRNAKAKLFKLSKNAVINTDDGVAQYIIQNSKGEVKTYGIDNDCNLKAINIEYVSNGTNFEVWINNRIEKFFIAILGKFNVYNLLGVIGAALSLNIPVETIRKGIANIKGVPGRFQNVPNDLGINVIVDYAHTPESLANIIEAVRGITKGRLITVFGCGGDKDRTKRPVMGKISGDNSDYTILTSDNPRSENPETIIEAIEAGFSENANYEKISDRKLAIKRGIEMAKKGDSVIIAGKGHEDYQILADRTIHFDDIEVSREILGSNTNSN